MCKKPRIHIPANPSQVPAPEPESYLDQVMIRIPCYEPNSYQFQLTGEDLTRNVLIVGTVGSGKTTGIINRCLDEAIRFRAHDPDQKLGLVVFDLKADRTADKIRTIAKAAGREKDLLVLDGESPLRLPLFSQIQNFEDIEPLVECIKIASKEMTGENAFWEESRTKYLSAFLTSLTASFPELTFHQTLTWLNRLISRDRLDPSHADFVEIIVRMENLIAALPPDDILKSFLLNAQSCLQEWLKCESRSQSSHAGCLRNLLSPFNELNAARFFSGGLGQRLGCTQGSYPLDIRSVIERGKILVVSIPAAAYPNQAALVAALVKAQLYAAIADRVPQKHDTDRLILLVMDEYPLVATGNHPRYGDVEMLATARSRRLGVIAAAQGLINLEQAIGTGPTRAVLSNFNTQIFMRTNDPTTSHYARDQLGVKIVKPSPSRSSPQEKSGYGTDWAPPPPQPPHPPNETFSPVCPLGALGRLDGFQAFVRSADGTTTLDPVQFVPHFLQLTAAPASRSTRYNRRKLLQQVEANLSYQPHPAKSPSSGPKLRPHDPQTPFG